MNDVEFRVSSLLKDLINSLIWSLTPREGEEHQPLTEGIQPQHKRAGKKDLNVFKSKGVWGGRCILEVS